jgi:hypothetical protein
MQKLRNLDGEGFFFFSFRKQNQPGTREMTTAVTIDKGAQKKHNEQQGGKVNTKNLKHLE